MLCVMSIRQHLSCLVAPAASHEETHADASSLTSNLQQADDVAADDENPLGVWERQDIRWSF
jgi:hypothetical protein